MNDCTLDIFDKADSLLHMAFQRYIDCTTADSSYFNIFWAIGREHDEAQIHSKIIYFLLNSGCSRDGHDDFLRLFLQTVKIPRQYLDDKWLAYRERVFKMDG